MNKDLHMMSDKFDDDGDTAVITDVKPKTKRPPLYKVMLLNDDFTPMEFVVMILERFLVKITPKRLRLCWLFTKKVWLLLAYTTTK